jgi:hypothetical protein
MLLQEGLKMKSLVKVVITALVAGIFSPATQAETQTTEEPKPPKSICETMAHFADFDFWLGEWNVYSNDETRKLQGSNSITKHHKNCLIMENWTSQQGGTGRSMNYYDPVEDQWRQLWVAGGYSIDYTGGLNESGSMVLNGKINYYKTGKTHAFRGTWTPKEDGSVRQFFEQQNEESKEWSVWFDGLYIKK